MHQNGKCCGFLLGITLVTLVATDRGQTLVSVYILQNVLYCILQLHHLFQYIVSHFCNNSLD
jgi:hypothetical protein